MGENATGASERIAELESEDCEDREYMADLTARMEARLSELGALYREHFASIDDLCELACSSSNDLAWHRMSVLGRERTGIVSRVAEAGGRRFGALVAFGEPSSDDVEAMQRGTSSFLRDLSYAFGSRDLRVVCSSGIYIYFVGDDTLNNAAGEPATLDDLIADAVKGKP